MKFQFSDSFIINSKIEPWSIEGLRVCFFGGSGSGKSWTAALFIEQWLDQGLKNIAQLALVEELLLHGFMQK